MNARELGVRPLAGLPEVREGDDVGAMVASVASLRRDEVVVLSQKVVSKAEGRIRTLSEVRPGERAHEVAELVGKSAELVELILAESRAVIRASRMARFLASSASTSLRPTWARSCLTATGRPSRSSMASQTTPIPPVPTWRTRR